MYRCFSVNALLCTVIAYMYTLLCRLFVAVVILLIYWLHVDVNICEIISVYVSVCLHIPLTS